ncbi:MAG: hypothetical protein AB7F96_13550 [Beijerinckiaceae bacterium]
MTTKPIARSMALACALAVAVCLAPVERARAAVFHVCQFDTATLSFGGSPQEQAACLLSMPGQKRHVRLPAVLQRLVGRDAGGVAQRLERLLAARGYDSAHVGGDVRARFSKARAGYASAPLPRYFVIHDTAAPVFRGSFPRDIDTSPRVNRLDGYLGPDAVAHVFINRLGASRSGHDFDVPWRGTKFEVFVMREAGLGMFLHVELVQPRRIAPSGRTIGLRPGFTQRQYERLALTYAAASARAGHWLIPALHARVDQGLQNAHTDPHDFSLHAFAKALQRLLADLNAGS